MKKADDRCRSEDSSIPHGVGCQWAHERRDTYDTRLSKHLEFERHLEAIGSSTTVDAILHLSYDSMCALDATCLGSGQSKAMESVIGRELGDPETSHSECHGLSSKVGPP